MVLLDECGDAVAEVRALVDGPVSIVVPGPLRSRDRDIDLLGARAGQVSEPLAGDGGDDGCRVPARVDVGTGDPQA